ncbi:MULTISPECIES: enoyl-CoA hydratase/isomerase family protein [Anaerococcus]|uniref:enoyl-CoA hydratase/isomerase family protein n=1 Tax=Anaerococcus TaxID=165779 RepID=UPI002432A1AE|nr:MULTISPECIES: enoyl-CoA hydratase/isomerase family protein [Anaerococcus]MDD7766901.1 enoyl-CoA hydratase/isomerase family protein [Anaerococcus vaginalis]MDY6127300.1 enoyl-CoA hydratase/isomerase family protein [Anaerococcus sp.]
MIKEKIIENIGIIYLDKKEVINALNLEMVKDIEKILKKWEDDDKIKAVLFGSLCKKGFCAGGDLKEIYEDYLLNESCPNKDEFYEEEFILDKYVKNYKKPVFSHYFGIVMGGGIGLSINSDFIIADQSVNWAMPETRLGFVPDVGVCKHISKLPQSLGQYLGLCGESLGTKDLISYDLADLSIKSDDYEKVLNLLFDLSKKYEGEKLIEEFRKESEKFKNIEENSKISKDLEKIEKYFSKSSIEEIFDNLEENKEKDEFAKNALEILYEKSPFMLKVQFEKYFVCKNLSQDEVFDLDLKILKYSRKEGLMEEGIRSLIIDKEKANWKEKSVDQVPDEKVKKLLGIEKMYREK